LKKKLKYDTTTILKFYFIDNTNESFVCQGLFPLTKKKKYFFDFFDLQWCTRLPFYSVSRKKFSRNILFLRSAFFSDFEKK